MEEGTTSNVLVIVTANRLQTVVVKNSEFGTSARWKWPGGGKRPNETPEGGGIREVREETNLILERRQLRLLSDQRIALGHHRYIFRAFYDRPLPLLPPIGRTGELIRICSLVDIYNDPDFLPEHKKLAEPIWELLRKFGQLPPLHEEGSPGPA